MSPRFSAAASKEGPAREAVVGGLARLDDERRCCPAGGVRDGAAQGQHLHSVARTEDPHRLLRRGQVKMFEGENGPEERLGGVVFRVSAWLFCLPDECVIDVPQFFLQLRTASENCEVWAHE